MEEVDRPTVKVRKKDMYKPLLVLALTGRG
jgi:hypothetical protein